MLRTAILLVAGTLVLGLGGMFALAADSAPATAPAPAGGVLSFTMKDIDGNPVELSEYKGDVILMMNVASYCGNTPQYTGLEKLYQTYKDKGFVILAFPANDFGHQEPGTNAEIKEFCTQGKYHVTFPLFAKISVKGDDMDPLYKVLTSFKSDTVKPGNITWNFEKFLIGRDGTIVNRFIPTTKPDNAKLVSAIEAELAKKN